MKTTVTAVLKTTGRLEFIVVTGVLVLLVALTSVVIFGPSAAGRPAHAGAAVSQSRLGNRNAPPVLRRLDESTACEPAIDETARALERQGIDVICPGGGTTCESAIDETGRALERLEIDVICAP